MGVGVGDGDGLGLGVGVGDGDGVGLGVGLGDGDADGVEWGVGDGETAGPPASVPGRITASVATATSTTATARSGGLLALLVVGRSPFRVVIRRSCAAPADRATELRPKRIYDIRRPSERHVCRCRRTLGP